MDLEGLLLEKLKGHLRLLQDSKEREDISLAALESILAGDTARKFSSELVSDAERRKFILKFLSYGIIEPFLCDVNVEDIVIHGLDPIFIHHSERGFVRTDACFNHERELDIFIKKLTVFGGKEQIKRIADLELADLGGRANIITSPFGAQITITKAKPEPLSVIDLIEAKSLSYEVAAQLWLYIDGMSVKPANILIAGGPGTGKTTLLNSLFSFFPEKDHLVIIEDTLELNTLEMEGISRLESDEELSLADLIKNSLRMRPERIIVGEVRGAEARDMMTAMNVGKYCMCTIHALTSREAIIRLQSDPMNLPAQLVGLIDAFVVLRRFHVDGRLFRVVDEISETGGMEQSKILLSPVYKYNYEKHNFSMLSPSTIYRDKLARELGITPRDIINETILRAVTLKQVHERGVHTQLDVTTFCRAYRNDPTAAMKSVGLDRKSLTKEVAKL